MLLPITEVWSIDYGQLFDPQEVLRYRWRKDCGQSLDLNSVGWAKGGDSFVVRLREGLSGRYLGYTRTYTDPGGLLCAPSYVVYPSCSR